MKKVFVVCRPTHKVNDEVVPKMNLKPAEKFGEMSYLLDQNQSVQAIVPTVRELKDKLRGFSDDDYLLPVGDPLLIALSSMVASSYNGGRVKFLKWDRFDKRYYEVQCDLSGRAV